MTLTNGSSAVGGGGAPPTAGLFQGGLDAFSASANIQMLLQSNNDLILAVHKSIVESSQDLGRKIESLRDDIRDIKLNQQKNDHTLQQESTNWRGHVEKLLKEQGDRHFHDTGRLQEMLMKMCIGPQPQQQQQLPPFPMIGGDGFGSSAMSQFIDPYTGMPMPQLSVPKVSSMHDLLYGSGSWYKKAPSPPSMTLQEALTPSTIPGPFFQPAAAVPAPVKPSPPVVTAPPPQKQVQEPAGFTFKKAITTTGAPTPVAAAPPTFGPTATGTTTTTTVPTTRTFGLSMFGDGAAAAAKAQEQQQPIAAAGFKPPPSTTAGPVGLVTPFSAATPPSATGTTGSLFGTGGGGGSLFGGGGGTKTGTNTFANLAAKTTGGGGFLGAVSTGPAGTGITASGPPKPPTSQPFGASPFGSVKDFKLFGASPNASARSKDSTSYREHRGTEEENDESDKDEDDYTPDVHYEPAVPLPPEVEVLSGEEGEEVRFVARCKLYRFDRDSKENKERGLGDIKILFNPTTKKYRCVMRREKVLKLAANFPIHGDLKLHKREQLHQVYTWACKDFSEDQVNGTDETFSARFKDANIAEEFNQKMTEAIQEMQKQP